MINGSIALLLHTNIILSLLTEKNQGINILCTAHLILYVPVFSLTLKDICIYKLAIIFGIYIFQRDMGIKQQTRSYYLSIPVRLSALQVIP